MGAYISGAPWKPAKIDRFSSMVGRPPSVVMWYQGWAHAGIMVKVSVTRGDIPPDSGRSKRIAKFKRDLVLDLFLRRGQFWEAIKEARQYCDHVARPAMPPQNKGLLLVIHMDDAGWSAYGEEFRRKLTEKVPEPERQVVPRRATG